MKITINLHRALDPVHLMQQDAKARRAAGAAWLERWQRLVPVTPPTPGPSAREIIATDRSRLDAVHSVQELVRTNPRLSTLRELIAALGGELELVARLPDRSYAIRMSEGE